MTDRKPKSPLANPELRSYTRASFQTAKGDRDIATSILYSKLAANKSLFRTLTEPLIRYALHRLILNEIRRRRVALQRQVSKSPEAPKSPEATPTPAPESLDLLTYPLSCSKFLGEADAREVEHEASMHYELASSNANRAAWFNEIQAQLPPGTLVKACFDHPTLYALQEAVKSTEE